MNKENDDGFFGAYERAAEGSKPEKQNRVAGTRNESKGPAPSRTKPQRVAPTRNTEPIPRKRHLVDHAPAPSPSEPWLMEKKKERLVSRKEAAEMLNCSLRHIDNLRAAGVLNRVATRVSKHRVKFRYVDVVALMDEAESL